MKIFAYATPAGGTSSKPKSGSKGKVTAPRANRVPTPARTVKATRTSNTAPRVG
jgi:hypothetical protein